MPYLFANTPHKRGLMFTLPALAAITLAAAGLWYWLDTPGIIPSAEGRAILERIELTQPHVLREIRASRDHFSCAGIGAKSFGRADSETYTLYWFREDTREVLGMSGGVCAARNDCGKLFPVAQTWEREGCRDRFFDHADRRARTIMQDVNAEKREEGMVLRAAEKLQGVPGRGKAD